MQFICESVWETAENSNDRRKAKTGSFESIIHLWRKVSSPSYDWEFIFDAGERTSGPYIRLCCLRPAPSFFFVELLLHGLPHR